VPQVPGEDRFQPVGDGQRTLRRAALRRPARGGRGTGEFDQGQRIARRLPQNPGPGAAGGPLRLLIQQPVRRGTAQRPDLQPLIALVEAGQHGRGPYAHQQRHGFAVHTPGHEGEDVQ
jgi:hypothetical protein